MPPKGSFEQSTPIKGNLKAKAAINGSEQKKSFKYPEKSQRYRGTGRVQAIKTQLLEDEQMSQREPDAKKRKTSV